MVLNQEQQLLKDTIAGFLDEHAPVAAMRKLRDEDGPGYDPGLWQQMVARAYQLPCYLKPTMASDLAGLV